MTWSVVSGRERDPGGVECRRVRRGPAGITTGHDRARGAPGGPQRSPRRRLRRRRGCARPARIGRAVAGRRQARSDRSGIAGRRGVGRASSSAPSAPARRPSPSEALGDEHEGGGGAGALVARTVRIPHEATDHVTIAVGDRHVGEPDRLGLRAAVRPGDPGDRHGQVRVEPRRAPSAIATAGLGRHGPVRGERRPGTPRPSRP